MRRFKEIQVEVGLRENFTAASLMYRYAMDTHDVGFERGYYGEARLQIEGVWYVYHHWHIKNEADKTVVTLQLMESLNQTKK